MCCLHVLHAEVYFSVLVREKRERTANVPLFILLKFKCAFQRLVAVHFFVLRMHLV